MGTRGHSIEVTAGPADVDDLGHVNNLVYLQWIERCFREHADRVGYPVERMRSLGALPVVRRHSAIYRSSARAGDRLVVTTEVTRARGPLATRFNTVRLAADDTLLVEVETDWVWLDVTTGKPRAPVPAIVSAFGMDLPAARN